jgi:hypothetical protein
MKQLLMLFVFALVSCGPSLWHLEDAEGQRISVKDPRFEPDESIPFRVGQASRDIEARHIDWLEVDPGSVRVENGSVLYGARLVLRSGERFPDSTSSDTLRGVFVGVDAQLVGSMGSSQIRIPLAQVRKFGTEEGFQNPADSTRKEP